MKTGFNIVVVVFLAITLSAAETENIVIGWDGSAYHSPESGPKIGLALSGGGARGLAQIGILKALEESGLEIRAIAGTSIGGIIGGLYAAGYSADELEEIISGIDFGELFSNRPSRTTMLLTQRPEKERFLLSMRFDGLKPYIPQALTAGQKLTDLLTRLTLKANYISDGDFSNLKIPFRAVTTDIVRGQKIILSEGNLADAMRSTMAFPLAFTGVESGNMILMDGGMLDPIPVDVARNIDGNLDLIIAVNTTSGLLPKKDISDPIDIANQVTSIMTMDKMFDGLNAADIAINPDINGYNSTDFKWALDLIELGYQAGCNALPDILGKLEASDSNDSLFLENLDLGNPTPDIDPESFPLKSGQLFKRSTLRETAADLYDSLNLYSISITAALSENDDENYPRASLRVQAISKPDKRELKYKIDGNHIFDDSTIIALFSGGPHLLSSEDILAFSDSLSSMYRNEGFDLAHIRRLDYNPAENVLEIEIDEAVIKRIEIRGHERTKKWLIKSNFPLDEGKPFNTKAARRGISNIYATDLFDRVTMNILPGEDGAIVRINVEEKKYTQVRLGWRWDDEYRSEEFVELLDDNLFGTGQELLLHARYASRRQDYSISLKADRFFSTYLTYNVKSYYNILDRKLYDDRGDWTASVREDRLGIEFVLGQQIARFGTVTAEIKWDEIKNKFTPGPNTDRIKLRAITLRSLVETINRIPFPTEGKKHLFYVQFAADVLGGETEYTKFFSSIESYFPLTERLNFHPKLAVGYTDTKHIMPISEKFYVGGHYSFYGYRTDELAGAKAVLGNLEIRYKLPYRFYISGRYDFGEVYSTIDQIKLRNLRHGLGISLAFDTPVGPIDFGYGKSGSNPDCFYLDIGLLF